jgi:hypothetical protein
MRTVSILLFACGWLAGCGESKLDQLTNGGGCSADDTVAGVRGRCPNEQLARALGWFDRDGASANGCEGVLQPSSDTLTTDGDLRLPFGGYTVKKMSILVTAVL